MKAVTLDTLMLLPWLLVLAALLVMAISRLAGVGARDPGVRARRPGLASVVGALSGASAVVVAALAARSLSTLATEGSFQYLGAGGFVGARLSSDLAPLALRPFIPLVLEPLTGPLLLAVAVLGAAGVLGLAAGHVAGRFHSSAVAAGLLLEAAVLLVVLVDRPEHLVACFAVAGAVGAIAPVLEGQREGLTKLFGVQRLGDAGLLVTLVTLSASLGGFSSDSLLAGAPSLEPWDRVTTGAFAGAPHRTLWFAAAVGVIVGVASRAGLLCWPLLRDATAHPAVPPPLSGMVQGLAFHGCAGILLLRLHPVIALSPEAQDGLVVVGAATVVLAGALALAGRDLLRIDAHLLAAFSGLVAICAGTQDVAGATLGTLYVLAAGLGLPWTFALVVEHTAAADDAHGGRRDPRALGGLEKKLPRTHSTRLLLTAGLAALPPFCGFVVVERALEAAVLSTRVPAAVVVAICVGVVLAGLGAWRALHLVFTGAPRAGAALDPAALPSASPVAATAPADAPAPSNAAEVRREPSWASTLPALLVAFVAPALTVLAIPRGLLLLLPYDIVYDPVLPSFVQPSLEETKPLRALFLAAQAPPALFGSAIAPSTFALLVVALGLLPWLLSAALWRQGPRRLQQALAANAAVAAVARWLARLAGQDSAVARSVQESVERLSRLLAVNLVPTVLSLLLQRLPQVVAFGVASVVRLTQNGGAQLAFFFALLAVVGLVWAGGLGPDPPAVLPAPAKG